MKRIIALSKLNGFNLLDYSYLLFVFSHFISLPFLLYFTNILLVPFIILECIILYISIIFVYEIYNEFSSKDLKLRDYEYKCFLWMSIIFQISLIIFVLCVPQMDTEKTILVYSLVFVIIIAMITYLFIILIYLILILNFFYYILLKKIFPEESNGDSQEYVSISILSNQINLPEQKLYLNTAVVNFIVYILAVVYVFLGLMSLVPSNNDIIKIIVDFSKENSIASFGNTLGIVSLTIAIYTTTYTVQSKIYYEALAKFTENNNGED